MTHHVIVSTVLNLSSDLMILGIMMPIFIKIQLPWKRKLIVVGLFGLGIFTVGSTSEPTLMMTWHDIC